MKKYRVVFTTIYKEEDIKNIKYPFCGNMECKVRLCNKWADKEMTIQELEDNIKELGEVIFDGDEIEVYNDYRE